MSTSDYELARKLQDELNGNYSHGSDSIEEVSSSPIRKRPYTEFDLDGTQQIVHPLWETLDPTPDILGMFKGFNSKFFQDKLHCVELEWSKKMYSCAGICYQRKNRYGMACIIRLSEPLLKLRSRKNLVETLLHEMIHAYLFILHIREGNGGHGPNFKRIMTNINKAAGTNITVYHTFNDEVNFYKSHIWRCNGICQHRGPFFGYVRRTSNRAPGPNDQWWRMHHEQCGGHFLKVSEPDPVEKKRKIKTTAPTVTNTSSRIDNPKWGMVKKATPKGTASKVSTIVVRKPATGKSSTTETVTSTGQINADLSAGRSLSNVVGFKDLNGTTTNPSSKVRTPVSSNGRTLGSCGSLTQQTSTLTNTRENVRDIWSKKFSTTASVNQPQQSDRKPEQTLITPEESEWVMLDDDIGIENVVYETVTILDESVQIVNDSSSDRLVRQTFDESSIKREIVTSFGDELTDSDIELIDHDYDDNEMPVDGSCNRQITDNLFSFNKSTEELNKIHMEDEENAGNPDKELVSCPVCNVKCERDLMSDHLDGCLGLTRKVDPRRAVKPPIRGTTLKTKKPHRTSTITAPTSEEEEYNRRILNEMEAERRNSSVVENDEVREWTECPVCTNSVKTSEINDHLDFCLS